MSLSKRTFLNLELQNATVKVNHFKNILAIDYGTQFCGLAFSPDGVVILPLKVVPILDFELQIKTIIESRSVELLVFGLPTSVSGAKNKLCKKIESVGRRLAEQLELRCDFVNEQFSSKSVLTASDNRIDDLAAAKILEFYLARKS